MKRFVLAMGLAVSGCSEPHFKEPGPFIADLATGESGCTWEVYVSKDHNVWLGNKATKIQCTWGAGYPLVTRLASGKWRVNMRSTARVGTLSDEQLSNIYWIRVDEVIWDF